MSEQCKHPNRTYHGMGYWECTDCNESLDEKENDEAEILRLKAKVDELEAQLEIVSFRPALDKEFMAELREMAEKWRNSTEVIQTEGMGMAGLAQYTISPADCADELTALLEKQEKP